MSTEPSLEACEHEWYVSQYRCLHCDKTPIEAATMIPAANADLRSMRAKIERLRVELAIERDKRYAAVCAREHDAKNLEYEITRLRAVLRQCVSEMTRADVRGWDSYHEAIVEGRKALGQ